MGINGVALGLSIFYVLFVPNSGPGIGIALCWTALVIWMTLRVKKSGTWNGSTDWTNTAFALALAILPAIATNELALTIGALTLTSYLALLVLRAGAPGCTIAPGTLPSLLTELFVRTLKSFVEGILNTLAFKSVRVGRKTLVGLSFSLLPLMFFHTLFAEVNSDYRFAAAQLLKVILDPELLLRIFQIWASYNLLTSIMSFSLQQSEYPIEEMPRQEVVTISIVPLIVLFGIFSLFQSTAVARTLDMETFKELSLYVQQGFWQLLFAGALGFTVWFVVHRRGADISRFLTVPEVLVTFALLLLCISLFTAHKVGLLQWSFGFKDQRLFATLAVSLLIFASGLCVLIVRGTLSPSKAQRLFTTLVLGSVCALSWLNIDLFASAVNPIRYYVDEKPVRDLSYLLGNSYDNTGAWKELMAEGVRDGIKMDPEYYWGQYQPLCRRWRDGTNYNYLEGRHQRLIAKYSAEITSLRQFGSMNLREFAAYRWLLENQALTQQFYAVARASC